MITKRQRRGIRNYIRDYTDGPTHNNPKFKSKTGFTTPSFADITISVTGACESGSSYGGTVTLCEYQFQVLSSGTVKASRLPFTHNGGYMGDVPWEIVFLQTREALDEYLDRVQAEIFTHNL